MATLKDLTKRMNAVSERIEVAASNKVKEVVAVMVNHLAYHTPVDTSQALSNWQAAINSPNLTSVPAHVPGMLGYTMTASAQETVARAANIVKIKEPGQSVYISNNLDYIRRLENGGWSKQPGGMMAGAIMLGRRKAKTKLEGI